MVSEILKIKDYSYELENVFWHAATLWLLEHKHIEERGNPLTDILPVDNFFSVRKAKKKYIKIKEALPSGFQYDTYSKYFYHHNSFGLQIASSSVDEERKVRYSLFRKTEFYFRNSGKFFKINMSDYLEACADKEKKWVKWYNENPTETKEPAHISKVSVEAISSDDIR